MEDERLKVEKEKREEMQGYTRRYTYNQLQGKPDNGKHR